MILKFFKENKEIYMKILLSTLKIYTILWVHIVAVMLILFFKYLLSEFQMSVNLLTVTYFLMSVNHQINTILIFSNSIISFTILSPLYKINH